MCLISNKPGRKACLYICLIIFAFLQSSGLWAKTDQQIIVNGKVSDSSGNPIPGVSVVVKNTTVGTITDIDGHYEISVPSANSILVFSFVGMQKKEFTIAGGKVLNVILEEESKAIQEVVITGYQEVDKRTFTGSVSKLDTTKFRQAGVADVSRMLQGTVAGVNVSNISGTFGTKTKIRIRGNSSISGNQEPVWVVDGIVLDDPVNVNPNQLYSGDAATLVSSAISGLNPNDIEEIQILKDPSATALYGTQAVNGVIVVITKKGKKGKTVVNYDANYTVSLKPSISKFNMMNSKQQMEFAEELYDKNLFDFTKMNENYGAFGKLLSDLSRKEITWEEFEQRKRQHMLYNTNWFDVLFRNSLTQEHSLSVTSGSDKSQYYFSGSYLHDNGYTLGQYAKRYTANMRANFILSPRITLGTILSGSQRDQRIFGTFDNEDNNGVPEREFNINPYSYAVTTSRDMRPYDDTGNPEYYQYNYAPFNIIEELENNYINLKASDIKLQAEAKVKILPALNFLGIYAARYTSTQREHIVTENSNVAKSYRAADSYEIRYWNEKLYDDPDDEDQENIVVLPRGGILFPNNTVGQFYTLRNSLNWKPRLSGYHFFDLFAGSEFKYKDYNDNSFTGYGFEYYKGRTASPDYRAIKRDLLTDGEAYYENSVFYYSDLSFFANLAYTYKTKYNATFSIRSDGSNRLGKSERFRFLPVWVIGMSWNIDKEAFLQPLEWVNVLKLRASYGLRGNVGGLGSPTLLAYYDLTSRFNSDNNENILDVESPENPNLQWEKEYMINTAIDFELFSKLSGTIEYYHRYNFNLIGEKEVSRCSGYETKDLNWADMKNEGIEFSIHAPVLKHNHFTWSTSLTFGYNKNTILNTYFSPSVMQATHPDGVAMEGGPVSGLYSFRFAGLNEEGLPLFYDENNKKSMEMTEYSRDIEMLKYEGSREPLGSGGITNIFSWKGFTLSALFIYSFGNKVRLKPIFSYYYTDIKALDQELANRWQAPGDEQYTAVPRIIDRDTRDRLLAGNADPVQYYNRSDIRIADGSFIRFKNITLLYNVPVSIRKKLKLQDLQLKLQGQNLALWSDPALNGQDPEALTTGVYIPSPTTFSIGFKLGF